MSRVGQLVANSSDSDRIGRGDLLVVLGAAQEIDTPASRLTGSARTEPSAGVGEGTLTEPLGGEEGGRAEVAPAPQAMLNMQWRSVTTFGT